MRDSTLDVIASILKADPKVTALRRKEVLAALSRDDTTTPALISPRAVRPAKAAETIGCNVRLIHRLAKEGKLRKVILPGRHRAIGILESDVIALINSSTRNQP